jgi:pimeloyl-ACP methyl ester carboxylesterase
VRQAPAGEQLLRVLVQLGRLATEVNPLMCYFRKRSLPIPTLYVMGEEDHMFLAPEREQVARDAYSQLEIIENCGHVCNVEQPEHFNRQSLAFISNQTAAI